VKSSPITARRADGDGHGSSIVMRRSKSLEASRQIGQPATSSPAIANTSKRETGCQHGTTSAPHQSDEPDPNDRPSGRTAALSVFMLHRMVLIAGRSA